MTTILVPLDGSKLAEEVLPHLEDLAKRLDAEVLFLQVLDVLSIAATVPLRSSSGRLLTTVEAQQELSKKAAEEYLSQKAETLQAKGIDARWETAEGRPATKIVEAAHDHQAYLIAMSTHGRTGLGQMVFGSVANEVLREARVPVLLVRPSHKGLGGS